MRGWKASSRVWAFATEWECMLFLELGAWEGEQFWEAEERSSLKVGLV